MVQLSRLADELKALGSPAAGPLTDTLNRFEADWQRHLTGRPCPICVRSHPRVAPCQAECPSGIDIPAFMALIGQGNYSEAVAVIRRDNPLPYICGLICPAPCEKICLRNEWDEPISIRAMKALAAKETLAGGGYPTPDMPPPLREKSCGHWGRPGRVDGCLFLSPQRPFGHCI